MKKLYLIIVFGCLLGFYSLATYAGMGESVEGRVATVTLSHLSGIDFDSARADFAYPDTTNWYVSCKLTPYNLSDSGQISGTVDLDSNGLHLVKIAYYERGATDTSGFVGGNWLHKSSPWSIDEADSIMAFIIRTDSLNALAGIHPGYKFDNDLATDIDTSYVISLDNTDTMWTIYYYHIGGPSGGTPDSTIPVSGAP